MQLYSAERRACQIIEGSAAAFTQFKVENNPEPSALLCFAARTQQGGKVSILFELYISLSLNMLR